ncbi:MAG: hypothetical protein V3R76_09635 [Gammaproteobacteria bacterium]
MSVVAECLSRLTLGETQTYHNLVIFPLVSEENVEPQYQLLDDASIAEIESFPAIGEGEDLRVRGTHLTGGALVKDSTVVHLCVFRIQEVADAKDDRLNRLARASLRRRHWSNGESHD